ncbi:hypothetical protein ACFYOR_35915 [Streptomyces griseofuscus]|nr:hypothetical protein [Streptomyces sp. SID685]
MCSTIAWTSRRRLCGPGEFLRRVLLGIGVDGVGGAGTLPQQAGADPAA